MAEIFQRAQTQLNGVWSSDRGKLSFGAGVSVVLVQNLQLNYQQTITRLYEVGTPNQISNVYLIGGRSQGNMSIARVIGPKATLGEFYRKYGNVCNAKTNNIRFNLEQADCSPGGGNVQLAYEAKFCVLTNIGIGVTSQDMLINESAQLMFSGLDYQGP